MDTNTNIFADGYASLAGRLRNAGIRISNEGVRKWHIHGIPSERVLEIVEAFDRTVTPHSLRPDLYPDPKWMPPSRPKKSKKRRG